MWGGRSRLPSLIYGRDARTTRVWLLSGKDCCKPQTEPFEVGVRHSIEFLVRTS
ncbi:hypothetical protein NUACC26_057960 [Scytonema sp. NUACC26]